MRSVVDWKTRLPRPVTDRAGRLRAQLTRHALWINSRLRATSSVYQQAWMVFLAIELLAFISFAWSYYNQPVIQNSSGLEEIGSADLVNVFDRTKMALLVETRPTNLMIPVILQTVSVLPPEWTVRMLGSEGSVAFIRSIPSMKRLIDVGKMDTQLLPSNVSTNSQETLSQFFTDDWTYRDTLQPAESLFTFQTDAISCANTPHNVGEFEKYPFIGAPWPDWMNPPEAKVWTQYCGNGGLSLRNVTALRLVTATKPRPVGDLLMEDAWLCKGMVDQKVPNMPTHDIALRFSAEAVYGYHPMGYHTGGSGKNTFGTVWGNASLRAELYDWCPEVKMIADMDVEDFLPGNCSESWEGV